MCKQIFEGCNFRGFCSQLVIHEIFILKICLASIREQDPHEQPRLTLAREGLWQVSTLPAAAVEVVLEAFPTLFMLTALINPFCMAPIWIVIYSGGNFDASNVRRFLDQMSLEVMRNDVTLQCAW